MQQKMGSIKALGDDHPEVARDTYRIAYIIHFVLGAGNLLPWNALIIAVDYFGSLYPNKHVEKVFSVAYMASSLLVLVVMILTTVRGGNLFGKMNSRLKLNLGFSMFVLSLMVAPVMDWLWWSSESNGRDNGGYAVMVISVIICGLADGLVGGSLMGSTGRLPKEYMQAVFAGTASSGVLVCLLRILTKAVLPQTPKGLRTSAHLYFMVSTIILLCCMVGCNLLYKLPVMQQHHCRHLQDYPPCSNPKIWDMTRKIKWPAFGIYTIYTVTLSIFPGFIAENLQSKLLKDWYPILLITVYNLADLVGKSLTAVYVVKSTNKATLACLARLLFYPLFTACLRGPGWLKTETPIVFLTFMLGLSNGYLTSSIMILVPKSVPVSESELSAIVLVVFLGIGLVSGSVFGWFWII